MNIKINKLFVVLILFFFISCASENKKVPQTKTTTPLEILYKQGYDNFEKGSYQIAIDFFQKVESDYSYTDWARKALLMKSFIYYDSSKYVEALENLQRYKKLYAGHKDLVYAEYLSAICVFEQLNFIGRDQLNAELSLRQFEKIIKQYPNTIYAKESKFKIDLVMDQLAAREMYVAKYYQNRGKWTASIQRLNNILEKYQTTIYVEEALHRLVEIHYKIGNMITAKKYAAILGYNFNDSDWYKKSYKIIERENISLKNSVNKSSLKEKLKNIFN